MKARFYNALTYAAPHPAVIENIKVISPDEIGYSEYLRLADWSMQAALTRINSGRVYWHDTENLYAGYLVSANDFVPVGKLPVIDWGFNWATAAFSSKDAAQKFYRNCEVRHSKVMYEPDGNVWLVRFCTLGK